MIDKTRWKNIFFTILLIILIASIIGLLFLSKSFIKGLLWVGAIALFVYLLFKLKIILMLKDYERAVVFRFGKLNRVGGPGWILVIPFIESRVIVTLRTQVFDIRPQSVLTKDSIQLTIDGLIYISIKSDKQSVINSILKVEDYKKASTLYVIAALRDVVGEFELTEVITKIEDINKKLEGNLKELTHEWGLKVHSVELSEIKIPDNILESMHEQKAAVQKKLAVYEMADSEKRKIDAIKEATNELSQETVMYYYIKALEKMAEGKSSKIIFPLELTNLLSNISTNVIGKGKNPQNVEQNIGDEKLKQFLPLIKGFIDKNNLQNNQKQTPKKTKPKKPKKKDSKK